jgi:alkylhydroperoxidase family enzyme
LLSLITTSELKMSAKMSDVAADPAAPAPRMPLVDISQLNDPELDGIIEKARRLSTPKPAWYQTLASNPGVAKAFAQYWDTVFRNGRVEHEIKELMRNCVAQLLGCSFCSTQRSTQAIEGGISEQAIENCALPDFHHPNPRTRAALRLARELALDNASRDPSRFDAVYAELHEVFDNEEIMELAGICVLFVGGTHLARSLGIDRT